MRAAVLAVAWVMLLAPAVPGAASDFLWGDANGDGAVSIADVKPILWAVTGLVALDGSQTAAADIDASGDVTVRDAVDLLKLVVGRETYPMLRFEEVMAAFLRASGAPGASLAVAKDGRLVYAQGFGWADTDHTQHFGADSLCRIASISKPITAVAALQLAEKGILSLQQPAIGLIGLEPFLRQGGVVDPRWYQVTVAQLLNHTGGIPSSYPPGYYDQLSISSDMGLPGPPTHTDIARYVMGTTALEFDPGSAYQYSDLGYVLLGMVIEKASGLPYEEYVKRSVLAPAGITRMRLGAGPESQLAPDEVRYTSDEGDLPNPVPGGPEAVPAPYAENMDLAYSAGGWIASAPELARFASTLLDAPTSPLLGPDALWALRQPPPAPVSRNADGSVADTYYGFGWTVSPGLEGTGDQTLSHGGAITGALAYLIHFSNGVTCAVVCNASGLEIGPANLWAPLETAVRQITAWPTTDLFPVHRL